MSTKPPAWYSVSNISQIDSPALLIYPDRVEENIRRLIGIAGAVQKLRPHVKTHKLPEIVRMHLARGIRKFKCATIAEAEMTAACGAPDVLLAYQPVGPKVERFLALMKTFPQTRFSTLADNADALAGLSKAAKKTRSDIEVFLDVDCGMERCGIAPSPEAIDLFRLLKSLPGLEPAGLHAYDGHIHGSDLLERTKACDAAFASVQALKQEIEEAGMPVRCIVAGGTPTFPIHALRGGVECSPGTYVFWDFGYTTGLPEMDFLPAALVLTRVISKPGTKRLCLDLGHKAIASENPHPRVHLLDLPGAKALTHSEEHLVVETAQGEKFAVGDCLYGIPWHICPTVALHSKAVVVRNGRAKEEWQIVGRERRLTI
jgi:D-serine deaminase-like pyridoxal phosphate-dependent protein